MGDMDSCKQCDFFAAINAHPTRKTDGVGRGYCQRYPLTKENGRPLIRETEWCGEFQMSPTVDGEK